MHRFFDLFKTNTQVEKIEEPVDTVEYPIVWIHGANQSSNSWNYIREKINHPREILVNYSSTEKFYNNLSTMIEQIGNEPIFVVGHSLGGIYALHLLKHCNVIGAVSVSTPFRGSSAADWAKFIVPQYQLFKDIGRRARPIIEANSIKINIPWKQIVSTTGAVPYLKEDNDGVCTIGSMEHRKQDMECVHVPHTHYEVMCSNIVVNEIEKSYSSTKQL